MYFKQKTSLKLDSEGRSMKKGVRKQKPKPDQSHKHAKHYGTCMTPSWTHHKPLKQLHHGKRKTKPALSPEPPTRDSKPSGSKYRYPHDNLQLFTQKGLEKYIPRLQPSEKDLRWWMLAEGEHKQWRQLGVKKTRKYGQEDDDKNIKKIKKKAKVEEAPHLSIWARIKQMQITAAKKPGKIDNVDAKLAAKTALIAERIAAGRRCRSGWVQEIRPLLKENLDLDDLRDKDMTPDKRKPWINEGSDHVDSDSPSSKDSSDDDVIDFKGYVKPPISEKDEAYENQDTPEKPPISESDDDDETFRHKKTWQTDDFSDEECV